MSAPVLPVGREDGYYLIDKGAVTFVPLATPPPKFRKAKINGRPTMLPVGQVVSFPRRDRAIERAVGATIEKAMDTPAGGE